MADIFAPKDPFKPEQPEWMKYALPAEEAETEPEGYFERKAAEGLEMERAPWGKKLALAAQQGPSLVRGPVKGALSALGGVAGVGQMAAGGLEAAYSRGAQAGGKVHPRIEQMLSVPAKVFGGVEAAFEGAGGALEAGREAISRDVEKQGAFGRIWSVTKGGDIGEVADSLMQLPMIISEEIPQFLLTGVASGAGKLAAYGTAWVLEAGHAYRDELAKGADEGTARVAAAAVGTANAFLERLAPGNLFRGIPRGVMTNVFRQAGTEGLTEMVQEGTQMLAGMGAGIRDNRYSNWDDARKKEWNWKRMLEAGFVGAMLGGAAGPVTGQHGEAQRAAADLAATQARVTALQEEMAAEPALDFGEGRSDYIRSVLDDAGFGEPGLQVIPAPDPSRLSTMVFRDEGGVPVGAVEWDPDNGEVANLAIDSKNPAVGLASRQLFLEARRQNVVNPDLDTMTEDSRRMLLRLEGGLGDRIAARAARQEARRAEAAARTPDEIAEQVRVEETEAPDPPLPPERPPGTPPPPSQPDPGYWREVHDETVGTRDKQRRGLKARMERVNIELFNEVAPIDISRRMTYAINERYGQYQLALNPVERGVFVRRQGESLAEKGDGYDKVAEPLMQILHGKDVDAIETLMLSEQDLANTRRGLPGTRPDRSVATIVSLQTAFGKEGFKALEDTATEWRDWLTKAYVDPALELGLITREDYDRIMFETDPETGERTPTKAFAPMVKLMDDLELEGVTLEETTGAPRATPKPKRRRTSWGKTGEGVVLNLLEVSIERSAAMAKFRAEMDLRQTYIEEAGKTAWLGPLVKRAPIESERIYVSAEEVGGEAGAPGTTIYRPRKDQPPDTFFVYEDGKRVFYTAPDTHLEALGSLSPTEVRAAVHLVLNPVAKVFGPLTRLKRSGITLPLEFMGKNLWRDQVEAFVYSPGWKTSYIPMVSFIEGMAEMAGDGAYKMDYIASGTGDSTFVSPDKETLQKHFAKITGDSKTDWTKWVNVVAAMRKASDSVEQITRLGVYTRGRKGGLSHEEAQQAARDATIDFRRGGATSKEINKVTAFFNATMRGTEKLYRYHFDDLIVKGMVKGDKAALKRGMDATIKAGIAITLPTVLLWLKNHDDEDYQEIPQWEKDYFWHFGKVSSEWMGKVPGLGILFRKVEGRDEYWLRAPKPHGIGWLFGSIPERFLNGMYKDKPESAMQLVGELVKSQLPSLAPDVAQTLFETRSGEGGWSYFFKRPIEPYGTEKLAPQMRFSHRTPQAVKAMSNAFNRLYASVGGDPLQSNLFEELLSPAKLDHVIYSFTGTMGRLALNAADHLGAVVGGEARQLPLPPEPSNVHFFKGFVSNMPGGSRSESSNRFYELAIRLDKAGSAITKAESQKRWDDAAELRRLHPEHILASQSRRFREDIADIRGRWHAAFNDKQLTQQQRAGILVSLDAIHMGLAKHYLGVLQQQTDALRKDM